MVKLYFTDYFEVTPDALARHGAFNISLVTDLPLFIDPFLLFNSKRADYHNLHEEIIRYLRFLRDRAASGPLGVGLKDSWYRFPEIPQTWLGFSESGNKGLGLGPSFGGKLHDNLANIFRDFGSEKITRSSHLEKLCLITDGVGNDKISDFVTNLIHGFLLRYTEQFAKLQIPPHLCREFAASRVRFNYETETWESGIFTLPALGSDYVLLTPTDILTKDDTWINRNDLINDFARIPNALPSKQLREQVNNYFSKRLPREPTRKEYDRAVLDTIGAFPALIDAYIRHKEDSGEVAKGISGEKVAFSNALYVQQFGQLAQLLADQSGFYDSPGITYQEARNRVDFFKDVIENKGGHAFFYVKGKVVERETDLHLLYRLTWFGTPVDVTREANDGRGPVDYKISMGSADKTLVEFKLASNSQLKRNLLNQAGVYERASDAKKTIKVIVYFSESQLRRVRGILRAIEAEGDPDIVLIDARRDNKPSGSKA